MFRLCHKLRSVQSSFCKTIRHDSATVAIWSFFRGRWHITGCRSVARSAPSCLVSARVTGAMALSQCFHNVLWFFKNLSWYLALATGCVAVALIIASTQFNVAADATESILSTLDVTDKATAKMMTGVDWILTISWILIGLLIAGEVLCESRFDQPCSTARDSPVGSNKPASTSCRRHT